MDKVIIQIYFWEIWLGLIEDDMVAMAWYDILAQEKKIEFSSVWILYFGDFTPSIHNKNESRLWVLEWPFKEWHKRDWFLYFSTTIYFNI